MMNGKFRFPVWLISFTLLGFIALTACDPGGRLTQLTPQPPPGTPILLGVTAESAGGGTLATSAPQPNEPTSTPPVIMPTATYDPARPAWTLLYYGGAENSRTGFVWDDLNEMEAAGPTDQVRIIAQIDWPEGGPSGSAETVRYVISADEDMSQLASEPVTLLGETNMGDPAALADFIAWGIATYPANRYALIVADFGGGWQGCCFDTTIGDAGTSDHLSLPDLDQALALAQSQAGGTRLDVIAMASSLMNQVDVLQTLQPYAAYAVASAGLVPGSSWDYEPVVEQLNADPLIDARQFSGDLVTAFVNFHRQLKGDEFTGMTAVDLSQVPALSGAIDTLALVMQTDPAVYGTIAADARRGAQKYGSAVLTDAERIAAVDILHAAAIIAETTPPGEFQSAALAVSASVTSAVIAYDHGLGLPAGRGIAIYWPASPDQIDPLYPQVSRLQSWAAYLTNANPDPPDAPLVTVDSSPRNPINIANPALLRSTVVGQRISSIVLTATQEAADGRQVLRQFQTVQPAPMTFPGGTTASLWVDGRHESLIIWDATGGYLSDTSGAGDFVPLQAVDFSSIGSQLGITGIFRPGGREIGSDATAVFVDTDSTLRHIWGIGSVISGARLISEVNPAVGDVFQPDVIFADSSGGFSTEPGAILVFDPTTVIYRSTRPLPAGNFAVGIRATAVGVPPASNSQSVVVDPALGATGYRAFVDAARNVQFLYPADWLPPTAQEGITFSSNISNTAQLQVRYYPGWATDLASLQNEVLGTFGDVSVLLQETTSVGSDAPVEAVRTAYGYDSADRGARTGMFLTFLKDGTGYVVDLDAPREQETNTLATVDTIAATWQFLPERLGFGPESWAVLNVSDFRMKYPANHTYQEFNGWHRFSADPRTFVAVRIQQASRTPAEAMASLLQTAAEGVNGFTADEPSRFFYAGRLWERNDFYYTDPEGNIVAGILLSRQDGNTEIAVWGEAPDPADDVIRSVFLPTAATIERIPPPPSG